MKTTLIVFALALIACLYCSCKGVTVLYCQPMVKTLGGLRPAGHDFPVFPKLGDTVRVIFSKKIKQTI